MKYKYIGTTPSIFKGKEIKEGDVIESDIEMSVTQFDKVVTPKKNIKVKE